MPLQAAPGGGSAVLTHVSRARAGEPPWMLDLLMVGCIFLIPQSFVLWWHSSEFGVSATARLPFFVVPGALVAVRLLWPHRRQIFVVDPIVVLLYGVLVLNGLGMALAYTEHPANVLSVYGQYAYWFVLVALMIRATAHRGGLYFLEITRRYFLIVAGAAWLFAVAWIVAEDVLPHTIVYFTPPGEDSALVLAKNYYLTLVYSYQTVLGVEIPRFTFLYREPRILGAHLVIGLVLQCAALAGAWSGPAATRRREIRNLVLIAGALVLTHSVYAYMLAACAMALALPSLLMREAYWRSFRSVNLLLLVLLLAGPIGLAMCAGRTQEVTGQATELVEAFGVDRFLGKPSSIVGSYLAAYASGPLAVAVFPLGTGIMNVDSARFERLFGIVTLQGGTLLQVFIQSAGVVGLVLGGLCIWRFLGHMARVARTMPSPEVRGVCLLAAYLVVVSTAIFDLVFLNAHALLLLGSMLGLRGVGSAGRAEA
jgi:hypothetical protein